MYALLKELMNYFGLVLKSGYIFTFLRLNKTSKIKIMVEKVKLNFSYSSNFIWYINQINVYYYSGFRLFRLIKKINKSQRHFNLSEVYIAYIANKWYMHQARERFLRTLERLTCVHIYLLIYRRHSISLKLVFHTILMSWLRVY